MLAPVTGLTQTGQTGTSTAFAWNDDLDADFYLVGVDGQTPVQVAADMATVVAPAGNHTVSVAPGLAPTPASTLGFSVTPPPPPPVPTGVAPKSVNTSSIVLGWNLSAGASSYTVFLNGSALSPSPTAASLTVNGLQPATAYQFSVVANGVGGSSSASAPITVTTAALPPPPPPPSGSIAPVLVGAGVLGAAALVYATSKRRQS